MAEFVIFDLDGTLLDTLTDIRASVNHSLSALNQPLKSMEEVRKAVGNGYAALMARLVGDKRLSAKALELFDEYYSNHFNDNTAPYDGVIDSIRHLYEKGIGMAVVSNKNDREVNALCERFFSPFITTYVGVTDSVPKKPAPDMLLTAMKRIGADPETTVMVGDGEQDVAMAKAAGIDVVCVTYGFRTRGELEKCGGRRFLESPTELRNLSGQTLI